jgi:hypothetical protein
VIEETRENITALGILLKDELRKFSFTVERVEYENGSELHKLVLGRRYSFLERFAKKRHYEPVFGLICSSLSECWDYPYKKS